MSNYLALSLGTSLIIYSQTMQNAPANLLESLQRRRCSTHRGPWGTRHEQQPTGQGPEGQARLVKNDGAGMQAPKHACMHACMQTKTNTCMASSKERLRERDITTVRAKGSGHIGVRCMSMRLCCVCVCVSMYVFCVSMRIKSQELGVSLP